MLLRLIIVAFGISLISCEGTGELIEADNLYESGDFNGAVALYTKYIELHPGNTKALYNRGRSFEELGKVEDALADFEQVLKIDKEHTQANVSMAMDQYFRLKDYPNSIEYLNNALAGEKKSPKAFTLRGKAYQKLGDLKKAASDYNNAISTDSEFGDAYYARGSLKVFLGKNVDACTDFRLASSLGLAEADAAVKKYCK